MTEPFSRLAEALKDRRAIISDRAFYERDPKAHLEALQKASHAIELASAALPRPVNPELAHFLERASYDKALSFLEQR